MKKTRALLGIAAGIGLTAVGAPAQAAPPEPVTINFPIEVGAEFGSCDFPVDVVGTGKAKAIETPSGGVIGVSAKTKVTATNRDTGASVQYSINGTFHVTTDAVGNVVTKATGRNLLTDPDAGVVVTSGNFTFAFDPQGNLVQGLSGNGRIIDVCADLS